MDQNEPGMLVSLLRRLLQGPLRDGDGVEASFARPYGRKVFQKR